MKNELIKCLNTIKNAIQLVLNKMEKCILNELFIINAYF